MKRATTSFPVPDSPCRRTVASVAATCVALRSTSFHSADCPIAGRPPSRRARSRLDARVEPIRRARAFRPCSRSASAKACSIAAIKSASAYGFVKNSSAPALIARTDVGMSPWPVRKMIEVRAPDLASRCCRSRPLSPGSRTSNIRQLGTSAQRTGRNSWADSKVSTFHPADRMSLADCIAHRRIVIDDVYGGRCCRHGPPPSIRPSFRAQRRSRWP